MTFEEFWKENYEKEFGTSEPYYGIASYAFEKGQENCNCVYTDNSNVIQKLEKENAELRKVAEFQQSSNINTHLENKKLKETLTVGTTWNKHLNSRNKALEEETNKYRNMVFDKMEQIDKAKEIIKKLMSFPVRLCSCIHTVDFEKTREEAEQFLKEIEE